jgi:magnesium-transporting ATPase (P-type)
MTLAVSVLVMSVPEGLPMMITLVLSTNSKKMLKDNVLVRKMVGIETAGSLNILFTDKTGTLTKGKMEVISVLDGELKEYYSKDELKSVYYTLFTDSLIYNNDSEYDITTGKIIGGNITDKALLSYANKRRDKNIKVIDKICFNSKNKYAISIIEKNNKKIKLIKGAPDKIIKFCNNYVNCDGKSKQLNKSRLLEYIDSKTQMGLRAIAIAISESIYPSDGLRRSTLLGVIFIKDDIRAEAKEGVGLIKKAGINVVMITGDSKSTAVSIANEVGIINNDKDIAITSSEMEKLNDYEIPYKCKWEERLVGVGKRIRKRYYVDIFIPEDYKLKYESIKVQPKEFEKVKELEGVDINDNDTTYEPFEKMLKIAMTIMKCIMAIVLIGIVYNIIDAITM